MKVYKYIRLLEKLTTKKVTLEDVDLLPQSFFNIENIEKILADLNWKISIATFLDTGHWGGAFLTTSGHVLKITTSKREARLSKQLINKSFIHFPHVYLIKSIVTKDKLDKEIEIFFILKEWINSDIEVVRQIKQLDSLASDIFFNDLEAILISQKEQFLTLIKNKTPEFSKDQIKQLLQVVEQLSELLVEFGKVSSGEAVDFNPENFGSRDGQIVCFDPFGG